MDAMHPPAGQVAPSTAHRNDLQWAVERWNTAKFPLLVVCAPADDSGDPVGAVRPERPVRVYVYWTAQHLPPSTAAWRWRSRMKPATRAISCR